MLLTNRVSPDSLRVFEAAARHANFTAAARELHSTQSAVSQRIHKLEQQLDLPLFERVHRGVKLTEAGQSLYVSVREGFSSIERTIGQLQREQRQPHLKILTDFAFAAYWLLPRLPQFRAQHPCIDVQIIADQSVAGWMDQDVDVAIVFCDEPHLNNALRLFGEDVLPVCSPIFLERHGPIPDIQALGKMPLLGLTTNKDPPWLDWSRYFLRQGGPRHAVSPHLTFNNYTLLIQAAIAGQGVALGWQGLIDEPLRSRMLIGLDNMQLGTRCGYGLIDAQPEFPSSAKDALHEWLAGCLEQTQQG